MDAGSAPSASRQHHRSRWMLSSLTLAAVAAVVLLIVAIPHGDAARSYGRAIEPVAERPREHWSIASPDELSDAFRHRGRVLVAFSGRSGSYVVALDGADGAELWRTRPVFASPVTLSLIGDSTFVAAVDDDGITTVRELDTATGSERSARTLRGRFRFVDELGMGRILVATDRRRLAVIRPDNEFDTLDYGDILFFLPDHIVVERSDGIAAYDTATLEPLTPPTQSAFDARATLVDDTLYLAEEGSISRHDGDGTATWTLNAGVGPIHGVVPVGDDRVLVDGADGFALVDGSGDRGRTRWTRLDSREIEGMWVAAGSTYALLIDPAAGPGAAPPGDGDSATGAFPLMAVVRLGDDAPVEVAALEHAGDGDPTGGDELTIAGDVVYRELRRDDATEITALALDDLSARWSIVIDFESDSDHRVVYLDGGVLAVASSDRGSLLTMYD